MLSTRVSKLKPSATLALNAKAQEMAKAGRDMISFAVGEPDWDTFEFIKKAAIEALEKGFTKYTPAAGIPELRAAVVERTKQDLGVSFEPSQCTIGIGAKQVIYNLLQVLCNPGDEVIIPAPYWVSYPVMAELAEAKVISPVCTREFGFKLTPEVLKNVMSAKTKVILLNSPNNPTGQVYTAEELKGLANVLERTGVWIISDDIYDRMIFTGEKIAPHIVQVNDKIMDQVILVNSVSKTYSMTGWRLGSAIGNKKVIEACTNIQSQSSSCPVAFAQKGAVAALTGPQGDVDKAMVTLDQRRQLLLKSIRSVNGVDILEPKGAFYAWLSVEKLFGRKTYQGQTLSNSTEFAGALLEGEGVAVVPGIEFGMEGYVRLSYTLSEKKLLQGMERLGRFVASLN